MLTLLAKADVYAPEPLGIKSLLVAGSSIVWLGDTPPRMPQALGVRTRDLGGRR